MQRNNHQNDSLRAYTVCLLCTCLVAICVVAAVWTEPQPHGHFLKERTKKAHIDLVGMYRTPSTPAQKQTLSIILPTTSEQNAADSNEAPQTAANVKEISLDAPIYAEIKASKPNTADVEAVSPEHPSHLEAGGGKLHPNIVVPVVGIYGKAEPHLSVGFHNHADSKKTDVPKHNDATGKSETHSVKNVAETDIPQAQTHPTEDMRPEAEASGEWDWRVCPSSFGCPCPMMP